MEITSLSAHLSDLENDTVIVGVTPADIAPLTKKDSKKDTPKSKSQRRPSRQAQGTGFSLLSLNEAEEGRLARQIAQFDFKAAVGAQMVFSPRSLPAIERIVLVGMGDLAAAQPQRTEQLRTFGAAVAAIARHNHAANPAVFVPQMKAKESESVEGFIEGLTLGQYRFTTYKKKSSQKEFELEAISLGADRSLDKSAVAVAHADAKATIMARDLINLPPNDCVPATLVAKAREIAKASKFQIDVFDRAALKKMGAGSLLAVAHGSEEPPYLIRMVKPGKKKTARKIAIVGKGVTFDSGGLSIKPAQSMEDMKSDMAGAAAVLGAMQAIASDKLDVEVRCYVPTVENMINGKATRPGDIVRAMNGTSIEILNTDAEGRLILADAVCLAEKDGCDIIVDLATLTGACMVALGMEYAGLFATDEKLAQSLSAAAAAAGEKIWRLPLPPEYRKLMDSPVADIKNSGPRWGGAITGAIFIKEFVTNPKTAWAHIDIAGPSYADGDKGYIKKGGVGFGVRTLARWLREVR